jgi:hypothetical protein
MSNFVLITSGYSQDGYGTITCSFTGITGPMSISNSYSIMGPVDQLRLINSDSTLVPYNTLNYGNLNSSGGYNGVNFIIPTGNYFNAGYTAWNSSRINPTLMYSSDGISYYYNGTNIGLATSIVWNGTMWIASGILTFSNLFISLLIFFFLLLNIISILSF